LLKTGKGFLLNKDMHIALLMRMKLLIKTKI